MGITKFSSEGKIWIWCNETDCRGSVMSGTDLTSYSAVHLSDYQANRRAEIQAELSERAWQRHAAVYIVFLLFFIISVIVMVIIYGGIQQNGLILSIHRHTVNTTARKSFFFTFSFIYLDLSLGRRASPAPDLRRTRSGCRTRSTRAGGSTSGTTSVTSLHRI